MVTMLTGLSMAQAQNPECMTNLSIYAEHVKVKNYDAAYEPWKMVYESCPDINKANFSYGERILKSKIDNSTGADKDAYIQDLLALYDNSLKYFPTKYSEAGVAIDKALLLYDNKMASDEEIFSMLDKGFKEDQANFKNPKALYLYFSSLVDLHDAGKKDLQDVFETYDDVTGKIEEENQELTSIVTKLLPKDSLGTMTTKEKRMFKVASVNSENYGKIASSIDSKLGALADCDNLIPLYEKNFDERKDDVKWVKAAVGRMFSKECTDDPMFRKLFEAQLALDPSADAYMYGGVLKQKSGDLNGALADFNKAVELETDSYKKSDILYKIATTVRNSSKSQARSYALKAIDANPANGKAYLLIANLYATSANACGDTPFEKRAIYWKAASMARKAGTVDPALSGRASQTAASYDAKAPSKEMIFSSGKAGQTISFNCWVGGSVTVPNL
jgi:tetratricopeptide (TPR) repeat protein